MGEGATPRMKVLLVNHGRAGEFGGGMESSFVRQANDSGKGGTLL